MPRFKGSVDRDGFHCTFTSFLVAGVSQFVKFPAPQESVVRTQNVFVGEIMTQARSTLGGLNQGGACFQLPA